MNAEIGMSLNLFNTLVVTLTQALFLILSMADLQQSSKMKKGGNHEYYRFTYAFKSIG